MDAEPDKTHRVSRYDLILEHALGFPIQFFRKLVDAGDLIVSCLGGLSEHALNSLGDERSAILCYLVDLAGKVVGQRYLNCHVRVG